MRATSLTLLLTATTLAFAPLAQAHDDDDGPKKGDISSKLMTCRILTRSMCAAFTASM